MISRSKSFRSAPLGLALPLFLMAPIAAFAAQLSIISTQPETPTPAHPQLNGQRFRLTTVLQPGYVDVEKDEVTGELKYSGYLIDILNAISRSDRGNFKFDLLPPSGFGSQCIGRLDFPNGTTDHPQAYDDQFSTQYKCAESDVNDRPLSTYSTDMYWGLFYITTKRLAVSKFTVPISPPAIGTLGMMGTATGIRSIEDLATNHSHMPVCAFAGTAYIDLLVVSFPTLEVVPIGYKRPMVHKALSDGTCEIVIATYAELQGMVLEYWKDGLCLFNEKPLGVIGNPLEYGLNHFAFGVRPDLPDEVLGTINYWINALETCFPDDPDSLCSEEQGGGSLSQMFEGVGGTGYECGYVLFPPEEKDTLSPGVIAAIVISPVVLVLALAMVYHMHQLKRQEKRMKKRFIQQLARNIEIGDSARDIPAEKLTEAFKHIGGEDGMISKEDLGRWLNDLHMDFMSEQDFNRLWDTLDMEGRGLVDPIDFISFLSQCGPQFKEVHSEYSALPKAERMKLAARRLSNISELGEEGVADMERRNNRRSRQNVGVSARTLRDSGLSIRSGGSAS